MRKAENLVNGIVDDHQVKKSLKSTFNSNDWKVRPWGQFLETNSFKKPVTANEWAQRCRTNLNYYRLNYLSIAVVSFLLTSYYQPGFLIALALIGFGTAVLMKLEPLMIKGHRITYQEKIGIITVGALLVFWMTNSFKALSWSAVISSAAILAHTSLRQASIKSKVSNFVRGMKEDIKSEVLQ